MTPAAHDITSPATYADPARVHAAYAELRRNAPVVWVEHPDYQPFWALTRYAEIADVARRNQVFINAPRLTLIPRAVEQGLVAQGMGRETSVRTIIDMDEPDHRTYRAVMESWFLGPGVAKFRNRVEAIVERFVDRMVEMGGRCDFARDVANWVPLHVIMSMLGLPEKDAPFLLRTTLAMRAARDSELQRDVEQHDTEECQQLFAYLAEMVERRRREPNDDLASVIASGLVYGATMGMLETLTHMIIASTAGHETTNSAMSGGMLALLQNPAAMHRLREQPASWDTAAEEVVRWVSPVRHFMRTATEDAEIGGTRIRAGQSLAMFYLSANRDETAFDAPFEFRPDRTPNRHLGFGIGGHVCLGRLLALAEIKALFRAVLARFGSIELDGDAQWLQSNFVGGLKQLPIRYRVAA